jgi:hypothetical protein
MTASRRVRNWRITARTCSGAPHLPLGPSAPNRDVGELDNHQRDQPMDHGGSHQSTHRDIGLNYSCISIMDHTADVQEISARVADFHSRQQPFRIYHGATNSPWTMVAATRAPIETLGSTIAVYLSVSISRMRVRVLQMCKRSQHG